MFCREQAARFNERVDEIDRKGGRVIAIGNGTATMAQDFKDKFSLRFELYTDPERNSYRAAGWRRPKMFGLKVVARAGRALLGGHMQGRTQGDPFQIGGVLVVGGDGEVLFEHADAEAGDHANVDQVIAALP